MIEALAQTIAGFLIEKKAANEEDREVIAAGWFHILSSGLQIIILAVSSYYLRIMPAIVSFVLGFTSLKRYIGGAHASKHWICLWGFTFLAYGGYFICHLVPPDFVRFFSIVASSTMLILVFKKAPVQHPHNPLSNKLRNKMRAISLKMASIQLSVILFFVLLSPELVVSFMGGAPITIGVPELCILCGALGGMSASVTLILPIPSIPAVDERR